jgi:NitT/TauT family transport system substrate-binding protein
MAQGRFSRRSLIASIPSLLTAPAVARAQAPPQTLRVGHFPNITHAQSLIARATARQGKGWFESRLADTKIDWFTYNAGPSAMEAIFAGSIDLTYVGPNPAINAYVRARGTDIRIVAGAANGGAALVVQPDLPVKTAADFRGRKIATPQFGNTQDVSARAWLTAAGLRITQTGGDAQVVPTSNPDQLALFKSRQLDAVWTVEAWVSRLEMEASGKVLVDDRTSITTVLAASVRALQRRRDLVAKFVGAHKDLTTWMLANPHDAKRLAREELDIITRTQTPVELIDRAWSRIVFTSDVTREALESFLKSAQAVGFLRDTADLAQLVDTP